MGRVCSSKLHATHISSLRHLPHGHQALTASATQLVLLDLPDSLGQFFYNLSQQMDGLVQQQLSGKLVSRLCGVHTVTLVGYSASGYCRAGVGPTTFVVVLFAGLLTSLSPCTLSILPLTIGYIGGYSDSANELKGSPFLSR